MTTSTYPHLHDLLCAHTGIEDLVVYVGVHEE